MLQDLRQLRIFKDIPQHLLEMIQPRIKRVAATQGETILELKARDLPFEQFYFITKGQVKAVGLDEDARTIPINFLRKGDFFVDKSFSWRSLVVTKMIALTDVEILQIPRLEMKTVADDHGMLENQLRGLAEKIDYRNRIYCEDKYARTVLAFLIDNELTNASRVKITQLDKCIECNVCYQSCENRHGFQRLERGYARFGILDFAKSCITCYYPTCIPACPVDSVVFNLQNSEVEILDSCIGCTSCSTACQYGAIKMYKVVGDDRRFARFLQPDKKVQPKVIADKCNHCDGHEDMACIVNCPTGAIIEVEASELLENPRIFGTGVGAKPLPSLIKKSWLDSILQKFYLLALAVSSLWLAMECLALRKFPSLSVLLLLQNNGVIPKEFELRFEHGSPFCNLLGIVGFTLIFIGLSYPLRKAFPRFFKYFGKQPMWLDFHNFCGLLGLTFVTFHTGFYFPTQPSSMGYVSLLLVAMSGVFGRFLMLMIPRGVAGTELKIREIEEEDESITLKLDAMFEGSSDHQLFIEKVVRSVAHDPTKTPTVWAMFKSIAHTWFLLLTLRLRMPRGLKLHRRQIRPFLTLLHDKIRLKRNVSFLGLSKRLFMVWRFIHVPFAYLTLSIVLGHIIFNLIFSSKL